MRPHDDLVIGKCFRQAGNGAREGLKYLAQMIDPALVISFLFGTKRDAALLQHLNDTVATGKAIEAGEIRVDQNIAAKSGVQILHVLPEDIAQRRAQQVETGISEYVSPVSRLWHYFENVVALHVAPGEK